MKLLDNVPPSSSISRHLLPACYGQLDPMQAERFERLDFIASDADAKLLMAASQAMDFRRFRMDVPLSYGPGSGAGRCSSCATIIVCHTINAKSSILFLSSSVQRFIEPAISLRRPSKQRRDCDTWWPGCGSSSPARPTRDAQTLPATISSACFMRASISEIPSISTISSRAAEAASYTLRTSSLASLPTSEAKT
ncbi:hypothetical protein FB45DRAFT_124107 [Roridomyces roridus]|uniref:Uncharacterized protein n=1 Tax=Roridomyces roridus TaxID=1738132 RepID=A0AAD7BJ82_9AGAR|nr:hypothetical protein FB45DRAFT_124107 [Roridomyces roridus]